MGTTKRNKTLPKRNHTQPKATATDEASVAPAVKDSPVPDRRDCGHAAAEVLVIAEPPELSATSSQPSASSLTAAERAKLKTWFKRDDAVAVPRFERSKTGRIVAKTESGEEALGDVLVSASLGIHDVDAAYRLLWQVARIGAGRQDGDDVMPRELEHAAALIGDIKPQDPVEGMLAAQMVCSHKLAMDFAARAASAQFPDEMSVNVERSTKMMRTFVAQVEALNKYRSRGQQKVVVEHQHVTVNQGGQAIVTAAVTPQLELPKSAAALPPKPAVAAVRSNRRARAKALAADGGGGDA